MSGKLKDVTGKIINNRLILGVAGQDSQGCYLWYYECNLCHKQPKSPARLHSLRKSRTAICCRPSLAKDHSPRWNGAGEISGHLVAQIRQGAKHRNIAFEITAQDMWDLFLQQERKCSYTGALLTFDSPRTASLDRIDSSEPYILSNVEWVHYDVNMAKQSLSSKDFIRLCCEVAQHVNSRSLAGGS